MSVLNSRIEGWNDGDGQAAAAFYAVNGILEKLDNGLVTEGRSQIAGRLQELVDGGFKMEATGSPIQLGWVVVEPVNLILEGQPGPYILVFDVGPDNQIYHQWVFPTGQ